VSLQIIFQKKLQFYYTVITVHRGQVNADIKTNELLDQFKDVKPKIHPNLNINIYTSIYILN